MMSLSKFELAAQKLGFNGYEKISYPDGTSIVVTRQEQQEALLKIFYLAGYFAPRKLWEDIFCFDKTSNPERIFRSVYSTLTEANAFQEDCTRFNASFLRENLFKSESLEVQDVMDYLLYVAQNAFNRKLGQERNELMRQEWMNQHINDYVASARILGLVDREFPKRLEYDEAWIAGASRLNLFARVIDYRYLLSQGIKITGLTLVLAGERPLWADLDGIDPKIYQKLVEALNMGANLDELDIFTFHGNDFRVEEGKRYIRDLAKRYCVVLDQTFPCIQYMTKEECPNGLFPKRFYPNYATNTEKKLTETVMAEDLIRSFLTDASIQVINTITQENQRPTTASTAYDAAKCFISKILSGAFGNQKDFFILLQTNNPHVERQTLATEREVNRALVNFGLDSYTITIHGVGFGCKRDITAMHSEFAALIAEKWKSACRIPKRDIKDLLFQTRASPSLIPDVPKEIKDI